MSHITLTFRKVFLSTLKKPVDSCLPSNTNDSECTVSTKEPHVEG
jgi:hypothetical protein